MQINFTNNIKIKNIGFFIKLINIKNIKIKY